MTSEELQAALYALDIPQARLAVLLDVDPMTVNRWAVGRLSVPGYAAAYVNLVADLCHARSRAASEEVVVAINEILAAILEQPLERAKG